MTNTKQTTAGAFEKFPSQNKSNMSDMINRLKDLKNFKAFADIEFMNTSISVSQRVSDTDTETNDTLEMAFDIEVVKKEAMDIKMETEPFVVKTEEHEN